MKNSRLLTKAFRMCVYKRDKRWPIGATSEANECGRNRAPHSAQLLSDANAKRGRNCSARRGRRPSLIDADANQRPNRRARWRMVYSLRFHSNRSFRLILVFIFVLSLCLIFTLKFIVTFIFIFMSM